MKSIRPIYVAVLFETRNYGGPEEGGWWFDRALVQSNELPHNHPKAGEKSIRTFLDHDHAHAFAERLQRFLDYTFPENQRCISSVASVGRYRAFVCEDYPEDYNPTRPRYE